MSDDRIEALIEASSLGTPEAKRLRASVSDETAARVLARAKEIEQEEAMTSDRESREELREAIARCMASIEPGEDWPTNAALGGSLTGTRDDEYRHAMREEADDLLDGPLAPLLDAADRADAAEARVAAGLAHADEIIADCSATRSPCTTCLLRADRIRAALAPAQGETGVG